ncbi:D-alanyl-D-alanine carboxypeptidase/D-alanyl-D-alanine-endopeptidase [Comamonadaceae bacterium G21597-S1]|nr:D-alanyl-D-alanine carboxypeptidase/D-alanyl-D-alanine-endopeptidase [Comamonadaceae bacterium G21597-S1]
MRTMRLVGPAIRAVRWLAATCLLGTAAHAQGLPAEVEAALVRAKLPLDAVSFLVVDAQGDRPARASHRAELAMNPASVMKLVSTYAALDLLGPAYSWRTPVFVDAPVRDGVLTGNLYLQGQGDPTLVAERLWLLMRRIRGLGIERIAGDIVLDRSAFALAPIDPGGFDGEPLRPYNAAPDALLLNYKSVVMTFVVDRPNNLARIHVNPPLAGVTIPPSVPLSGGDCGDYRGNLRADFSDPTRVRFAGSFPAACQERVWPIALPDPAGFAGRAVEGMWREVGGQLGGTVRDGRVPAGVTSAVLEFGSPTLAEVIRDINKYSNNVMAQQLFLSLSLPTRRPNGQDAVGGAPSAAAASFEASREVARVWWRERFGTLEPPLLDNGAGLSRGARVSALALARMLQVAWQSPWMPELMSSLPIAGVDGTMRRNRSRAAGSAHLKTGSLRDVVAIAGYVHANSGRRYVLVAMTNHANAYASRAAFDALLDWTIRDE